MSGSVAPVAPIRDVELPDVQAEPPAIALQLDEAGVSGLRYPITVYLSDGSQQATVASVAFGASVAADTRGVHMSRYVESLHVWRNRIGVSTLLALLCEIRERLDAQSAVARFDFPLFLERTGPVSGGGALVPYDCSLEGQVGPVAAKCPLTTRVPVTSLCPCSREISDYGAHNQRGIVEITVSFDLTPDVQHADFSDLIEV